jgi:hypothetical protein
MRIEGLRTRLPARVPVAAARRCFLDGTCGNPQLATHPSERRPCVNKCGMSGMCDCPNQADGGVDRQVLEGYVPGGLRGRRL